MPRGFDAYSDPYSDRIGELIRARGDIAARQSLESGDIWGRGIQNIAGQLAGGLQQYAQEREKKELEKKEKGRIGAQAAAVHEAISKGNYNELFRILPPDQAAKVAEGLKALRPDATKLYTDKMTLLSKVAQGIEALPEQNRPEGHTAAIQGLVHNNVLTPDEALEYAEYEPVRNRAVANYGVKQEEDYTLSEGQLRMRGTKVIGRGPEKEAKKYPVTVAGPTGPIQKLATEEEYAKGIPGYVPPQVDIEGRQIRAEERKTEREKEKAKETSVTAAKEADSQVDSAFSAMDTALKNLEKYSGTAAVTSPLEAANARQQYEDATKAFAATLARATGDNRISDLDRKAYADLVAYTGGGSAFLNITKPEFARNRFEQAKNFFKAAAKTRQGAGGKSRQVGRFTVEEE